MLKEGPDFLFKISGYSIIEFEIMRVDYISLHVMLPHLSHPKMLNNFEYSNTVSNQLDNGKVFHVQ